MADYAFGYDPPYELSNIGKEIRRSAEQMTAVPPASPIGPRLNECPGPTFRSITVDTYISVNVVRLLGRTHAKPRFDAPTQSHSEDAIKATKQTFA